MSYATLNECLELIPEVDSDEEVLVLEKLERASAEIDALCYGRIRKIGFENLTDFQQEKVRKAVCYHAAFLYNYAQELDTPLESYGINGVSMSFSGNKTVTQGGVTTTNTVMAQLRQSGLASRLIP